MNYRDGRTELAQMAAFDHADVRAIVDELVRFPEIVLLKLATRAILFEETPSDAALYGLIGPQLVLHDSLDAPARAIAEAGMNIGTAPDRTDRVRRRGAVLERLVHALVSVREPDRTSREQEIELTHSPRSHRSWTRPKEVIVDARAFEVYECKTDGLADLADIDELSDISSTATAEGTPARPTVVTFGTEMQLAALATTWRLTEPIYSATIDTLLDLRKRPPSRRIPS